jgi:hypothetical protein
LEETVDVNGFALTVGLVVRQDQQLDLTTVMISEHVKTDSIVLPRCLLQHIESFELVGEDLILNVGQK